MVAARLGEDQAASSRQLGRVESRSEGRATPDLHAHRIQSSLDPSSVSLDAPIRFRAGKREAKQVPLSTP